MPKNNKSNRQKASPGAQSRFTSENARENESDIRRASAEAESAVDSAKNEEAARRRNEITPDSIFHLALKLVAIGIVLYVTLSHIDKVGAVLGGIYDLLMPLLMGALLALVLNTPMCALERLCRFIGRRLHLPENQRVSSIIALVLTFGLALGLIYFIGNNIVPQIIESVSGIVRKIRDNMPEYLALLEKYGVDTDPISSWLRTIDVNKLISQFSEGALNLIGTVVSGASSIISGAFNAFTIVVFAIYILANKAKLGMQVKRIMYAYIKKPIVDKTLEICAMTSSTFSSFISGQCLDAVILGLMMFIAMSLFGFPYALAVCSLITVTAVIPYIGAFLGGAFGVLLMVIDEPLRAVFFVVLFIVVQQVDNHLVYPRVVGGSVGLPAIWTFAAVIIGNGVCGILGMILFIPLFSVLYTLIGTNVTSRLKRRGIDV